MESGPSADHVPTWDSHGHGRHYGDHQPQEGIDGHPGAADEHGDQDEHPTDGVIEVDGGTYAPEQPVGRLDDGWFVTQPIVEHLEGIALRINIVKKSERKDT